MGFRKALLCLPLLFVAIHAAVVTIDCSAHATEGRTSSQRYSCDGLHVHFHENKLGITSLPNDVLSVESQERFPMNVEQITKGDHHTLPTAYANYQPGDSILSLMPTTFARVI